MCKTDLFLTDFEAVARSFDAALEINIEMSMGRLRGVAYQEFIVRAYRQGQNDQPQQCVALVKGATKSEALTHLTDRLRANYPAEGQVALASAEAKQAVLDLVNHPLIDRNEKVKTLININRLTQSQAEAKQAELNAKILHLEGRPYQVVAICEKPAA